MYLDGVQPECGPGHRLPDGGFSPFSVVILGKSRSNTLDLAITDFSHILSNSLFSIIHLFDAADSDVKLKKK